MPLSKKAKIQRSQKKLKRKSSRRDLRSASAGSKPAATSGTGTSSLSSSRSRTNSGVNSTINSGSASSQQTSGRRRANANADINGGSKASRLTALKRKNADSKTDAKGKTASDNLKTKIDFATGRTLFPVESGGKTQYLPLESEANKTERRLGAFVSDDSLKTDPVNTFIPDQVSVHDLNTQRELFATENENGRREYLPKESEAIALELISGKYIPDNLVESPSIANKLLDTEENTNKLKLRYDFTYQRNLYAVEGKDGKTIYVPEKSKATAGELKRGFYVDDAEVNSKLKLGAAVAMTNDPPLYDFGKRREVYAVKDEDGKLLYLPRASEASPMERARGLFINDDTVDTHESKRLRTALSDNSSDSAQRRARRADKLAGGSTSKVNDKNIDTDPEPLKEAKDGTLLWDGATPPEISLEKQRKILAKFDPNYDVFKGRMLYPTEVAVGKVKYLPLLEDATDAERIRGQYVSFVPPEPLETFIQNNPDLYVENFDSELDEVTAYKQEDIEEAFENAPSLVLRSARYVSGVARQTPELKQQFTDQN